MNETDKLIEPVSKKEELMSVMWEQYTRQKSFCDRYYERAMEKEEDGSLDLNINKRTRKENTDVREYNLCVSALGNTISKILQIEKSVYAPVDDSDNLEADEDELV